MNSPSRRSSALNVMLPFRMCNYPANGVTSELTRAVGVFLYAFGVDGTIAPVIRTLQQARIWVGLRIGI